MLQTMKRALIGPTLALVAVCVTVVPAQAGVIAVFGNNATDNLLATFGHTVSLVTDADLATAGFLTPYDALFVTRDGSSFGVGFSAAAAANVIAWACGNVVLLNGDFADDIGNATTDLIYSNAAAYAVASGHGYVGEFNGAVMAMSSNSNGYIPLGLIAGSAGPTGFGAGGSSGSVTIAPAGIGHPVLTGVGLPYNPPAVEFGSHLAGYSASNVLATFDGANPAILSRAGICNPVPEPGSLALFGMGAMGLVMGAIRRRGRKTASV